MEGIIEKESKYLIDTCPNDFPWHKEHIVYQWYIQSDEKKSVKEKIIFDLKNVRVIHVIITKKKIKLGETNKDIEYLRNENDDFSRMLGRPFVLKRRAIFNKLFVDHFIRSNQICKYLLEYEGTDFESDIPSSISIEKEVTQDKRYYNENMCVKFEQRDLDNLNFLIKIFKLYPVDCTLAMK